ncbi:MAG: AzlC family ABC transporter permease [Clostridia bacterium]|nr:AzlC family ABC transporter permease [Clostridia bacterium]
MKRKSSFINGIIDGMPICLGYLSVAFAFGIFATESGLSVLETLFISMANVTSAGQLAAVPIITAGGSLAELCLCQIVINLRYALMSTSLSQKMDKSIRLLDKLIIAFVNTDEVFAVASGKRKNVKRSYMYGLILMPYLGWSVGTLTGALAGNILPTAIVSALGIAIYGMFVAIVVPEMKENTKTAWAVILAIVLSCAFEFLPLLNKVPDGFTVIICAVTASLIFALAFPIDLKEECENE